MLGSDDDGDGSTLHVQVKRELGSGVRATVATTGSVLHVQLFLWCVVSLFRQLQLSLWQQPAIHNGPTYIYKPLSTTTHHP